MTPTEVATKLRVFNDWRRGELDDLSMPDPREIGEAIDGAQNPPLIPQEN